MSPGLCCTARRARVRAISVGVADPAVALDLFVYIGMDVMATPRCLRDAACNKNVKAGPWKTKSK